jgi:hypothetical protein
MSAAQDFEDAVIERVTAGIRERLRTADPSGDPAWIADAMLDAIPTAHPFGELGPFYATSALAKWMHVTRQALHLKVKNHQVLACPDANGDRLYPAWQFTPDAQVLPGLGAVLKVLLDATDPWTAALWLTSPNADLPGELTAVEWLRTRRDPADVVGTARRDAARWAV